MFSKQSRVIKFYFYFSSLILLTLISYFTYSFWKNGMMNDDSDAQVYESMVLARELSETNNVDQIKNDVLRNNITSALQNLEKLEKNISQVGQIKKASKLDIELKEKSAVVKESVTKLTTYPSTSGLIQVLKEKISKFGMFVNENRWPTLIRLSDKMMQASHNLSPINFDTNSRVLRTIQHDVLTMKEVTERSVLSLENKALINLRMKSVEAELKMLSDFINDQRTFLAAHENYENTFKKWISSALPELNLKKTDIKSYSKEFLQTLLMIVGANVVLLMLGFLVFRFFAKREDKDSALYLKEMIENHLTVNHYRGHPDFAPELDKVLSNYHYYFQKRMNLGMIFQETLPFSTIIVDSNYKISWANQNFIETWDLSATDVREEKISWDFLKRFTNLEGNDPVGTALKNKIGGIFEISLQTTHNGKHLHYEMFVNPVEINGVSKAVVYFYPLEKHHDTMTSLNEMIVKPMHNHINALIEGNLTDEKHQAMGHIFEANGQAETFQKLTQLRTYIKESHAAFLNRISDLEMNLQDQIQVAQEESFQKQEIMKHTKAFTAQMNTLKGHVISQSEEFNNYGEKLDELKQAYVVLTQDWSVMKELNDEMVNGLKGHVEPILEMVKVKDEFKTYKNDMANSRNKLMTYFDQMQMFERTGSMLDQERLGQLMNKFKREMMELDRNILQLDKRFTHMEVQLSKAELMTSDVVNKVKEKDSVIVANGVEAKESMEQVFEECRVLSSKIGHLELAMINDFEEIHAILKRVRSFDEKASTLGFNSSKGKELSTM